MIKFKSINYRLLLPCLLLFSLSLVIIRSIAPNFLFLQLIFGLLSFTVFLFFSQLDHRLIFSLHLLIALATIVLLAMPFFLGHTSRGATRWLFFNGFTLQPSEIAKPFLLMSFIMLFYSRHRFRNLLLGFIFLLPLSLVFLQPDLGTFLVLLTGFIVVLLSRYRLMTLFFWFVLIVAIAAPLSRFLLRDYQRQRLITFINPYADPLGSGYHVIQSMISVGSGGFAGRGLGQGTQSQLRFLPEHQTDFIFASLSEELGFVGASIVIGTYLYLYYQIYCISKNVQDAAASSYCLSVLSMLAFQTLVNIGMNLGIVPITGVTLPFLSVGGSSLLSSGISLGLIAGINQTYRRQGIYQVG